MSSSVEDKHYMVFAVTITFLGLSLASIGIRIFTRLRLMKGLGADDILIAAGGVSVIAMAIAAIAATHYGLGKHIEEQKPEWRKPYQQSMLVASITFSIAAMFIRLSLLFFYLRIIQNRAFRLVTYSMIAISIGFGISSVVANGFRCVPLKLLWDRTAKGSCFDVVNFYLANAGIHILTEFVIYALPMPTLWKLQMPTRQKLGICGLMGIGAVLIVISCYRIATLKGVLHSTNITWDVVQPLLWFSIEVNLAIFVSCGPAFLAFFRHYIPGVFGGSSARTKPTHISHNNCYTLSPIGHVSRRHENGTGGIQTTVIAANRTGIAWYAEENGSEEMILRAEGGIQRQVDVWVVNEDMDSGKVDTRSNNSETDRIAQAI